MATKTQKKRRATPRTYRLPKSPSGGVELLLIQSVEHLGKQGEVVRVKPGYAMNYLVPQGLATIATDHHKRMVEKHRAKLEAIERARQAHLRAFADRIGKQSVTIEANATDDGHLYGSVGAHEIASALKAHGVRLVCLAGFMRLIGAPLLEAFPDAILNIHPSLLPAFPGVEAQRQAFEHGVKVTGVTVHFVTRELDGGPIVMQAAVPVRDDDTIETLSARILVEEHRLYAEAVQAILDGGWHLAGRRVVRDPDYQTPGTSR